MAAGTLFTYPQSFRANKALVAAQFSGADVKVAQNFKLGETNKTSDFLKKFPAGKVPTFEGKDGFCLSESNAIAYYVANSQLRGADEKQQSMVQQWISFSDNEIVPSACAWTFPCLGITQFNKQETERAKEHIKQALGLLNNHLLTRTYIVGERVTLADISLVCNLQSLYELVLDPAFRKPFENVNRWFTTLINQPQFKTVLGTVKLAASMATFDAKKYQEIHGGSGDKKKKGQEPAPKKEKAQPKPKEESKPAEVALPPPKAKDPLAGLPMGNMVLDDFKKVYSNEDTLSAAIPYFFKNFDKEACSIWRCDYVEDTSDMKMGFMCCNLVGGFFQRIEKLRKYAFGSMVIAGEPKKFSISGLWFWVGHKLVFDLDENWNIDAPSYKWTKVEFDSPELKDLVHRYFLWEGDFDFDGKKFEDGKIFK